MNSNVTINTVHASSSGYLCFVCEEPITDRTLLVNFSSFEASRSVNQIALHCECARDLADKILASSGVIRL